MLGEAARRFALLSDPTRLRILRAMHARGECTVQELADEAGTTLSNASQHLHRLHASGLVERRRTGKSVLYRIDDPTISALCELVCASLRARGEALSA